MSRGRTRHGHHDHAAPGAIDRAVAYDVLLTALSGVALGSRVGRIFRRIVAEAGVRAGDRVLDVGCGPGRLTALAAEAAAPDGTAVGVDVSPAMVDRARARHGGPRCAFHVGHAEALDQPDDSYDVVLSSLLIHHLPPGLQAAAVTEIRRVLRPGGRLVVADFHPPTTRIARHLVGVAAGPVMRDNPVDRLAPMITEAGLTVTATGHAAARVAYVSAVKPTPFDHGD